MVAVLAVGPGMGESLETAVALKGAVTCMETHVFSQMVLVLESLVAHCAWVGSLI